MKIVFSRKGFDSGSGGGSSPIVDGKPISLPIPDTKGIARTTYGDLGLGDHAARASRGTYGADSLCHHDPLFTDDGRCILGQVHSSQSHLANQGVGIGDVLLFFGLFAGGGEAAHHRIFGYLRIEEIVPLADASKETRARFLALNHPHALGMHGTNDTLYVGAGRRARQASAPLRLTVPEGPVTMWHRPPWLRRAEISYFPDKDANWPEGRMYRVGNGQEFVADVGDREEPRAWLAQVLAEIRA